MSINFLGKRFFKRFNFTVSARQLELIIARNLKLIGRITMALKCKHYSDESAKSTELNEIWPLLAIVEVYTAQ